MHIESESSFESFKQKLLSLEAELRALNEFGAASDNGVELDQSRVGRLTRMDALANAEMNKEASRRRALQLNLIKVALQKIDSGSYGECEECLEFINPERLGLDPAAKFCINCATQLEKSNL